MSSTEILDDLQEIFKEVFDNPDIVIGLDSFAGDIDEWDSLSHIQLVVAIEKKYQIRFLSKEIQNWKNVKELVASIQSKI
jgi:acyl carrier protein